LWRRQSLIILRFDSLLQRQAKGGRFMTRNDPWQPERELLLKVTEMELTLLVTLLEYMERRQLFLVNLASNQGRDKESFAQRWSSLAIELIEPRTERFSCWANPSR
jgi:hypothetical protein